jgi:hypothetical protein
MNRLLKVVGPAHICAHKHGRRNREGLAGSAKCGCFYCLRTFAPQSIKDWTDDGTTAICAHCGMDSVIGSGSGFQLSHRFLQPMNDRWFGESIRVKT